MSSRFPVLAAAQLAPAANASDGSIPKATGPIRLTIVCAAVLSVLVAIGTGLFLFDLRNRELASSERTLSNTALIVARQIEHFFATVESVQNDIIVETAIFEVSDPDESERKLSRSEIHLKLRDKAAGMPYVAFLTIVNAHGRMINSSGQWPVPDVDVSDRDFFKALQSDPNLTSFIGEPVRNRATGTWVMHLARKLSGPNGEFLGLTSAAIELQYLQHNFSEISFEPGSGISLFRNDGMLFVRNPRSESEIGRRFPNAVALKLVSAANQGVGVSFGGIDGQLRMVAAHRVGSHPVLVATTKTVALIFADWKRTAIYAIFTAVLIIIAIAAFAILFINLFRNYQALVKARANKENAEKLRDQSLRFEIAMNNMAHGVVMLDASSQIVVCNERYIQMYGLSREVVRPGLTLRELIQHRKDSGSFQGDPDEYCQQILDKIAKRQRLSRMVHTADGRTIHLINQPMADGGWVSTHEDVTEQRKVEQERDYNRKFLDMVIENVPSTIVVKNARDFSYALINRAGEDYYGIARDTMLGKTACDILPKQSADYVTELDRQLLSAARQPVIDEHMLEMPGGEKRIAMSKRLCIRDQDGEPQYLLAVVDDITAQREAKDRLREQKQQLDAAIANMAQGLIMFDASERVILCNQRYVDMCGLSPDAVTPGRTFRELLQARQAQGTFSHDLEQYRLELLNELALGKSITVTTSNADGRSYRVVNVPMAGGGWVATHEDVTEKIRAEEAIEQQKLQLDAALENMSQGLCLFDGEQRLIVCNKRYAGIYGLDEEQTRPGTTLRKILEYRVARGAIPNDHENYINDRLDEIAANKPHQITVQLRDGRYVTVVHRPMADGGWVATHEDVTEEKRREESFRLLFKSNPVPMWVYDRDSLFFLAVNDAAVAHYGYSHEQFLAMTVLDIRPPEERERFMQLVQRNDGNYNGEQIWRHQKADKTVIDVAIYSRALSYKGRAAGLTASVDVTDRKRAEDALRKTEAFLNAIVENVPLPIIVKSVPNALEKTDEYRFTLLNRAAETYFGTPRDAMIGKCSHDVYPKEHADFIVRHDSEALQASCPIQIREHSVKISERDNRIVTSRKVAIRDDDGKPKYLLTLLEDVTERKRADQRITYLAHNDSLTDLPNRATFVEHLTATLDEACKNGAQFTILCADLDRFKEANDAYGHLVGDGLLREVARRFKIVAAGAFLARVGGDEFTLIVTSGSQPTAAAALGGRMLAAFKDDFEVDGHRLQLGLSIGGAVYPADGADAKTLMANADAALYQAKSESRGAVRFFEPELATRLRDRRDLQNDLRLAVSRGEFFLHYQPQEKIATNETIGFEALVRWQSPKRGLVSPGQFISIAEESGLIVSLGEWILREACREAASWPQPLTIAVNISPVQFHHGDLARLVHSILLETGLSPARLELEITEGVLVDDFSRAVSILRKLKSLGVQIAMDDFGSGYSSLSYLHAFPFDKIKIDRTFIGDLEHNHHSMAIVRAIITLGHSLDVPVLAEGVESETQRQFLTQAGCDEVQGYLTGRPLPIADHAHLVGHAAVARRIAPAAR